MDMAKIGGPEIPSDESRLETKTNPTDKLIRLIQKSGIAEHLSSEESIREFIHNIDFEDYRKFLLSANGIMRNIPIAERVEDGTSAQWVGVDYLPRHEDKQPLVQETFEALKRMNDSGSSLEDMAILIALATNATHPFSDANGRSSRLLYYLLHEPHPDFESSITELRATISEGQGRGMIDFNPHYVGTVINEHIMKKMGLKAHDDTSPQYFMSRDGGDGKPAEELSANINIAPEDAAIIGRRILHFRENMQRGAGFLAVAKLLIDHGRLADYTVRREDEGRDYVAVGIAVDEVIRDLDANSAAELAENYWLMKKEFVSTIIDVVEHPSKYPMDEDKPDRTILDYQKGILRGKLSPHAKNESAAPSSETGEADDDGWIFNTEEDQY